jgi:hypothetical protein
MIEERGDERVFQIKNHIHEGAKVLAQRVFLLLLLLLLLLVLGSMAQDNRRHEDL